MHIKSIQCLIWVIFLLFTQNAFAQAINVDTPDHPPQIELKSSVSFIDNISSIVHEQFLLSDDFFSSNTLFISLSILVIILSVIYYLSSKKERSDNKRTAIIFVSLFMVSFSIIIILSTINNINRFDKYQKQLGMTSVNNAKENIEQFLFHKQNSINSFTHFFKPELLELLEISEDDEILTKLASEIKTHFPNYFTYNLISTSGLPLISQQSVKIGPICRTELQSIFKSGQLEVPIVLHGKKENNFHFDLRNTLINEDNEMFIFLVHFKMDALIDILKHSQLSNQVLLITRTESPDHIILSADGIQNNNIFGTQLNYANRQLMLFQAPIKHTGWTISAYPNSTFTKIYANSQWYYAVILIFSLSLISLR